MKDGKLEKTLDEAPQKVNQPEEFSLMDSSFKARSYLSPFSNRSQELLDDNSTSFSSVFNTYLTPFAHALQSSE